MSPDASPGARALVVAALLLACTGCVRLRYLRVSEGEPVSDRVLRPLRVGASDLGDCLMMLGAPSLVFPTESGRTITMAWLWSEESGFQLRASYNPLGGRTGTTLSFQFRSRMVDYQAVVLVVDEQLRVQVIRKGYLSEILPNFLLRRLNSIGGVSGVRGMPRLDDGPGR